jgi:cell division protein FtsB
MEDQYYRKARPKHVITAWCKQQFKKRSVLVTLLIGLPLTMFILFSNKGVLKRLSLEAEKRSMEEKVQAAQHEQQELQEQSKALDSDPRAIEKVAREKYGMIREGETVYKIRKER